MPDREADEQTPKQPGSFRHPLVVSASLRWADSAEPGIQKASDTRYAEAATSKALSVSLSQAVEAIPDEPLAQRMSRQLLEKRDATR